MKAVVDIFQTLKSKMKTKIKFKSLTKEDLISKIYNCNKRHSIVVSNMSSLNKDEMTKIFLKVNREQDKKLFEFVNNFRTKIVGNALRLEQDYYLQSVKEVNKGFVKILDNILNNIDKIMETEEISLFNSRLSMYSLMGLLKQSEIIGTYSQFLFGLVTELYINNSADIPKYRTIYLAANVDIFSKSLNDICNSKGTYNFLKDLSIIRQKGVDYKINPTDETATVLSVIRGIDYSNQIGISLSLFSIFSDMWSFIGERCVRYRSMKTERLEVTKDWLENRVALIKLDMSKTPVKSSEFIRLEKITNKYDDMISKLDRKISNYYEE